MELLFFGCIGKMGEYIYLLLLCEVWYEEGILFEEIKKNK